MAWNREAMADIIKSGKLRMLLEGGFVDRLDMECEKKRSDQVIQIWGLEQPDGNVIYRVREDREGQCPGWALTIWAEKPIRHPSGDVE